MIITINLGEQIVVIHGQPKPETVFEDAVAYRLVDTGDGRIRVYVEIDVELLRSRDSSAAYLAPPA